MKTYRIKEIFGPTIQGEGRYSGKVVKFLRFAGCNRWNGLEKYKPNSICNFCDTDFLGGVKMTSSEILKELDAIGGRSIDTIICTGGEPTIQLDNELCLKLYEAGYKLHLETNGSNNIDHIETYFQHITMSPKQSPQETKLYQCDDIKILFPFIGDDINPDAFDSFRASRRYLQPVYGDNYQDNLKNLIEYLYKKPEWMLSLQTHKIIGVQ